MEPSGSGSTDRPGQNADQSFRFVTIQDPEESKGREFRRSIRSHAVKQALQSKRKNERSRSEHFRLASFNPGSSSTVERGTQTDARVSSPLSTLGLFQSSSEDGEASGSRLRSLLRSDEAKQALEPVFSLGDDVALQNFRSVFRTGVDDPALLNAVLLTATFAATRNVLDREYLQYQTETIKIIRERISMSDTTTTISTMGAILLLAGIETRLGMRSQVEIHLKAIQRLLESSKIWQVYLTDGIRRAIFWQDLYSHILTASERIVTHNTFNELRWERDIFPSDIFVLSPGFQRKAQLFPEEFLEVLRDIHAMQCCRDSTFFAPEDTISMMHVDNQQAWVQSKLVGLPTLPCVQECCRWAAYLAASMLCCKIWRLSVMPPWISAQLLQKLQQRHDESVWDGHRDLLAWVLYIGGAFAPVGPVRSGYVGLVQEEHFQEHGHLTASWPDLVEVLRQFVWSEKAFYAQVKLFWEEAISVRQ
ncbi:uncharacterized protein A1O5_02429 [Cladophialophora psammophila CBS 110553]|uniref:Transcription factor domain-containing protein n=1 Tax=Cladophialophora psammophila CBS 110553 TaxID=1182543 RepID=W9X9X8_9EURO|nr:uncharacterized protein A1O5_02429 [Cladophialophora psammophila CBS 110553]EXJ74135.1 hypothetical protein A1O5_02429 [Cladophialophora psammophila CBS 110553]